MSCDANDVITQADMNDLISDIKTIDDVVESSLDTTTTKSGKVINTLLGELKLLGFIPPITYAAAISFTVSDNTKTVDEAGVVYAPLPSALPFTTSGTFIGDDDARFFVVQGLVAGDSSALISYQAGNNFAGGVDRTQENKNGDVISILDFGGDPTGATDSAAAINLAIAVGGQNTGDNGLGVKVIVPKGTYLLESSVVSIYSGVHIEGAGSNSTKFISNANSVSGHLIQTVDDARHFSLKGFRIDGQSNITSDGGLKIGNDSSDTGFIIGGNADDVIVSGFSKANAVGIKISNPSNLVCNNVIAQTIPNGVGCEFVANNTNTGIITFNSCKFGDIAATERGMRIISSGDGAAAISEVVFNACFFSGTEYSLLIDLNFAPASVNRGLVFIAAHFETDNSDAGSATCIVNAGSGINMINPAFHGFGNTKYGIYLSKTGFIRGFRITDTQGVDIATDIIHVEGSGSGTYERCIADGIYPVGILTTPSEISDTGDQFKLRAGGENLTAADGATTYDVYDIDLVRTANTGATSVTNFTRGSRDKVVYISAGDANTTIVNGATIITSTGVNKLLGINKTYQFIYRFGIWFEVGNT